MKKIFFFCICLPLTFFLQAQNNDDAKAVQLVSKNSAIIGLSAVQLENYKVSNTYYNEIAGTQMVYLLQTYKGLPIYNQMKVLAFKGDKLVSNEGAFLVDIDKKANSHSGRVAISARNAVKAAFTEVGVAVPSSLSPTRSDDNGKNLDYGMVKGVYEKVTAELMWVPIEKNGLHSVKLAWQVQVAPVGKVDLWQIQIDADNGAVIDKFNMNIEDSWGGADAIPQSDSWTEGHVIANNAPVVSNTVPMGFDKLFTVDNSASSSTTTTPSLVGTANYLVIPFPAESPAHPGGTEAVRTNPWTLSPGNATSLGWHNDGTTDYTISRGNNVWATEDRAGTNSTTTGLPATSSTTPDPLNFNFTPDYNSDATTTTDAANNFRQFAITNLFYWNNLMHDMSYQYGFNEAAGNFQANNQGRGGAQNDYVIAFAQSAAEGSIGNNANFSTPGDGGNGTMRMYLFNGPATLKVNTPATIAGNYYSSESGFSKTNKLNDVGPITAPVVYYNDNGTAGGTHNACNGSTPGSLTGKIVMIDRGNCNFVDKVKNAQNNGAVAVIMVNNVAGWPTTMGGDLDNSITIPAVMISDVDGANFAAQLANNVTVTLAGSVPLDGDLDAGIVCHEYGHGISTRLTGGPAKSSCLGQSVRGCDNVRENGSEGWSDYMALMMTTNWATAQLTDGSKARSMGTYVLGQPNSASGIRRTPYSTDMTIDPATYANVGDDKYCGEIHNIGEIWCAAIWDMTWNIIQQEGTVNPDIFNASAAGGNSIAMKLVMEGLRLQACPPGFIDSRNAILTADSNLYGGAHHCAIWNAFARRGMGWSASQGSATSCTDQTPAFDLPPAPAITTQPTDTSICAGNNATFTVAATGGNLKYKWQVSTDGGNNWADVVPAATTSTLTLTAVTAGMDGNRYRTVLTGGCAPATVNSDVAILTVGSTPAFITQPVDAVVACGGGGNATFTTVLSGTELTYKWQVSATGCAGTFTDLANTAPYSGVNTNTLTITGVTAAMNNTAYRLVVSSTCAPDTNSNCATLTVEGGTITAQPTSTTVCANSSATFTASATGTGATYQWQESTNGGGAWNDLSNTAPYSGVTTGTLTVDPVAFSMNGYQYRLAVSVTGCTATSNSNAATLMVNSQPSVSVNSSPASLCIGETATLTASGADTYTWSAGTTPTTGAVVTVIPTGTTTYTVTGTSTATGCKNTADVTVTAKAKPIITLSAAPYTSLIPGLSTTLTVNITPVVDSNNIVWYKNGIVIPGASGSTMNVTVDDLGTYSVNVTSPFNCPGASSSVTIADSVSNKLFISPNPNNGQFKIRFYTFYQNLGFLRTVLIYDSKGSIVYKKRIPITAPYSAMDVDMRKNSKGIYSVVLSDYQGKPLARGKVILQ